jgi:hypothetical protein
VAASVHLNTKLYTYHLRVRYVALLLTLKECLSSLMDHRNIMNTRNSSLPSKASLSCRICKAKWDLEISGYLSKANFCKANNIDPLRTCKAKGHVEILHCELGKQKGTWKSFIANLESKATWIFDVASCGHFHFWMRCVKSV